MNRIKIQLPDSFHFTCSIPVRITDLNYGSHVGNDSIFSFLHEARMQYLGSMGYSEMECGGAGLIMTAAAIEFKSELFYGDTVLVSVTAGSISQTSFDVLYKLEKETNGIKKTVAHARTSMVCFDYNRRKIVSLPQQTKDKLCRPVSENKQA